MAVARRLKHASEATDTASSNSSLPSLSGTAGTDLGTSCTQQNCDYVLNFQHWSALTMYEMGQS